MNRKALIGLFLVLPLLTTPAIYASSTVVVDEGHAIVPYIITTLTVYYQPSTTTASIKAPSVATAKITLEAGFIPTPQRAYALVKVHGLDRIKIANESVSSEEYKLEADKFTEDAKLDWLRPLEEIDIVQANASWVAVNPINSTGKYHLLLISWSKNFTLRKVFLDDDNNATNGYRVLFNSSFTGNMFWLVVPYGLWNYIYVEFGGTEIPTVKAIRNAVPVVDHRYFTEKNVIVEERPEELEYDTETTNLFVGTKNLHEFILDIIKDYVKENFGSDTVYAYNVSSVQFKLKVGKYIRYEGALAGAMPLQLALLDNLQSAFESVQLTIGTAIDEIKQTLTEASETANEAVNTYVASITDVVAKAQEAGADIASFFSDVGADIQTALQEAGLKLSDMVNTVGKSLGDFIAEARKDFVDFTGELLDAAVTVIGNTQAYVVQFANKAFGALTSFIQKAKWVLLGIIVIAVVLIGSLIALPLIQGKKRRF